MKSVLIFGILIFLRLFSKLFYRTRVRWLTPREQIPWDDIRLICILNHTSLMEPVFAHVLPLSMIWRMAKGGVYPVADITIRHPIFGKLFRMISPEVSSLSRRRDDTWKRFLEQAQAAEIVVFLPEGRMKRLNGLDKDGKEMTLKTGICDLLEVLPDTPILWAYSGGLHHVFAPGAKWPRLFQTISIALEIQSKNQILGPYQNLEPRDARHRFLEDLKMRRDRICSELESGYF